MRTYHEPMSLTTRYHAAKDEARWPFTSECSCRSHSCRPILESCVSLVADFCRAAWLSCFHSSHADVPPAAEAQTPLSGTAPLPFQQKLRFKQPTMGPRPAALHNKLNQHFQARRSHAMTRVLFQNPGMDPMFCQPLQRCLPCPLLGVGVGIQKG